ncbi:diaminopimelate decarboxylase [Salinicoccus roseus]|uniref:Diaminopimelate decarboxylase n=1 Tax=Salinicoccus roseus TaxID=45670 RepID=A0A0C2E9Q1_9STAP|nr:diaminopimelate decarboxylase [Salinicoccus roseus]KIH72002.1 diaminopimelate decarboxylase [Salinicoccus roseus]MDB0579152.1 diaminopimelate decarboxylase [Salinicoccus roseus]
MTLAYINDELHLNGHSLKGLAAQYGTPLFVYDEDALRSQCRRFHSVFEGEALDYSISYASKAFTSIQMVKLLEEENMKLDVVSAGELYMALEAGFPAADIHFHGNNKTAEEIEYALEMGIGLFVVDAVDEVALIDRLADHPVDVLLRINPGIDVNTHSYIQTGQEDSKFGLSIHNGTAESAIDMIHKSDKLNFKGVHYHLGSQISEEGPFLKALDVVFEWLSNASIDVEILNMGGGYGVRYTEADVRFPIEEGFSRIIGKLKTLAAEYDIALPHIMIEPGRSIAAEAGTTIYEVGVVKDIPGVSRYVSIDGGMSDHIRTPLYDAEYEVLTVEAGDGESIDSHVVGKLCESGDIIGKNLSLPDDISRGDLVAVATTGAYHYSMASNYNQMRKPAVVFVTEDDVREVIRRQSLKQLVQNDVI